MQLDKIDLDNAKEVRRYLKEIGLYKYIQTYFESPEVKSIIAKSYADFVSELTEIKAKMFPSPAIVIIEENMDVYDDTRPSKLFTTEMQLNVELSLVDELMKIASIEIIGKDLVGSAILLLKYWFSIPNNSDVLKFITGVVNGTTVEVIEAILTDAMTIEKEQLENFWKNAKD
jgi:hypothetical protein